MAGAAAVTPQVSYMFAAPTQLGALAPGSAHDEADARAAYAASASAAACAGLVAPLPPAMALTAPTAEPPRLFAPPYATPSMIGVQQPVAPRPTTF